MTNGSQLETQGPPAYERYLVPALFEPFTSDAATLPKADASFDLVCWQQGPQYFADQAGGEL